MSCGTKPHVVYYVTLKSLIIQLELGLGICQDRLSYQHGSNMFQNTEPLILNSLDEDYSKDPRTVKRWPLRNFTS